MSSLYANARLNNQVAFYDEVTEMVDRGSLKYVLTFCKAFCGPTQLPYLHTERHEFEGWTWMWWIRNWLEGHRELLSMAFCPVGDQ